MIEPVHNAGPAPTVEASATQSFARSRELPTTLWLGAVILLTAGIRFALAATVPGPGIFPDELIYSELAKGVGTSGAFLVRGVPFSGWTYGPLYVLLIAPAFRIASLPDAYLVAKAVNSVVMSFAAVPAYLLARRLVDRDLARLAAGLAVLMPAMAFSSRIMTESAFYPVFLLTVLTMVRALEKPTARRQLTALGLIAIACAIRPEALVFVPAFLTSICGQTALELRRAGRAHRPTLPSCLVAYRTTGVSLACAGLMLVIAAIAHRSAFASAWERADYVASRLTAPDIPKWFLYHIAELDLAVGVIPLAAAVLFLRLAFARDQPHRFVQSFAVVSAATTAWVVLLASAFASQAEVARVQERYFFYLEPLVLVAFLAWIGAGAPRFGRLSIFVVLVAALLPLVLPYGSLLNYHVFASTPGLVPWLYVRALAGTLPAILVIAGLSIGGGLALVRSRDARSLIAPVALYLAVGALVVSAAFQAVSDRSLAASGGADDRTWIDRAVGGHANVVALWSANGQPWMRFRRIWENEFFNGSVGSVYYLRAPLGYALPETRLQRRGRTLVLPNGEPLRAQYVLSDGAKIEGKPIAQKPGVHFVLYRVPGIVRLSIDTRAPDSSSSGLP